MPVQNTPDHDPAVAADGLWLLRDAHDRWLAEYTAATGTHGDPEHHRTIALRLHQHAAAVLTWSRALDDLCDGDPQPLPSYRAARPPQAVLLGGARYAANRSLHQLLTLTRSIGGISGSWSGPLILDEVGIIQWAEEWHLPPSHTEQPGQQKIRPHYVARYAGESIHGTLAELRAWFDQQLG